ncbi:MAG: hypothetical protein WED10_08390 [Brumimicrobium sp.]
MKSIIFKGFVLAIMVIGISFISCSQEQVRPKVKLKKAPPKVAMKSVEVAPQKVKVNNDAKIRRPKKEYPVKKQLHYKHVRMKSVKEKK